MQNDCITGQRIEMADVLRGFAVMGIMVLHCIEHFNFYSFPEVNSQWLRFTDKAIWDSMFFTFGGKAYGIFALLFGFSFFIQDNNQLQRGNDFRMRYIWRLFLLFIWGNINAMFFTAEILVTFALFGIVLVLTARLSNKTILILAGILLLQPIEWVRVIHALLNPDMEAAASMSGYYFKQVSPIQAEGNFIQMSKVNLWEGQLASITWAWENGRITQIPALFMLGMVIGRKGLFLNNEINLKFWSYVLPVSVICFFPLNGLTNILPGFIENPALRKPALLIVKAMSNFAFMSFLVSLLILAFYKTTRLHKLLGKLVPYGKMSLTCYVTQSIVGSFLFYNWGLGLHNKLGITASFFVGILLFLIQYGFAVWWMKRHKQGPLEFIWKKLTWIGAKKTNKNQ